MGSAIEVVEEGMTRADDQTHHASELVLVDKYMLFWTRWGTGEH
jgi:hypothetical protein